MMKSNENSTLAKLMLNGLRNKKDNKYINQQPKMMIEETS